MTVSALNSSTSAASFTMLPFIASVSAIAANADVVVTTQTNFLSSVTVWPASQIQSTWFKEQATNLRKLKYNWDGYGAEPVSASTLNSVVSILERYLPADSVPGSLVPGADGSVQAEWHLPNVSIGLLVEEGRTVSTWSINPAMPVETEHFGIEAINYFAALAATALANV